MARLIIYQIIPMYYSLCVTFPIQRLTAMNALIDTIKTQAKSKNMSDETILGLRLAPDMFSFSKQIQVMTDNAKGMAARLGGKDIPVFEDSETTLDELQARIQKTIDFIKTLTPADFVGAEKREARFPYFPGMKMVGEAYLTGYAIPNFLFHATTAYNILRNHGFEIGKQDFMLSLPLIPDAV